MPILRCTYGQLLRLSGTNAATARSDRFQAQNCAAFGTWEPLRKDHCLVLDAVAWSVRNILSDKKRMKRRIAAAVVREFWPEWMTALAYCEFRHLPYGFVVAQYSERGWWASYGLATSLPKLIADLPPEEVPQRLFTVNLPRIIEDIQQRAKKSRLDISGGSFGLPPDNEHFREWADTAVRKRKAHQRQFDPLHAGKPFTPTAELRKLIAEGSCLIQ
jgi:hypothetical protein